MELNRFYNYLNSGCIHQRSRRLVGRIVAIGIVILLSLSVGCDSGKPIKEVKDKAFQIASSNAQVVDLLGSPIVVPSQEASSNFTYHSDGSQEFESIYYIKGSKGEGKLHYKTRDKKGNDKFRLRYLAVKASGKEIVLVDN